MAMRRLEQRKRWSPSSSHLRFCGFFFAAFFAEGWRRLWPSTSSSNVADEEMKETAFFSLSKATRRRGAGDVTEAAYASFIYIYIYRRTARYALACCLEMMGYASADGKELLMSLSGLGAQMSADEVVILPIFADDSPFIPDSRLGVLRSIVTALLCGSSLQRRTLDLLYPHLQTCRDLRIYDFPR
ncbi:hypothetical protein C4D60_Mb10t26160 [Musa balbisiana]|uniref:Uncharacterized protein n=1 Tax=Musa balbisiana TaxID=52838 RepID=A0A4S8J0S8_MUSBA|nr:hypothetical protein C4D60_Mb10t26160 [Musa balbisiana]